MFKNTHAFSSFSVDDIARAREFYADTLFIDVSDAKEGLGLHIAGGGDVFLYPKPDHEPAAFTVLNFPVENIDHAVEELKSRGVIFESYDNEIKTDENGIFRGADDERGPNIAWFRDPAGNVLSVVEENGHT